MKESADFLLSKLLTRNGWIIIAGLLVLLLGIAMSVGLVAWQNGNLGPLPIQIKSDQHTWDYYNENLRDRRILYPTDPNLLWQEYLSSGSRKVLYLWVQNSSEKTSEVGIEVKSPTEISDKDLVAKIFVAGAAYNSTTSASCLTLSLAPKSIAEVPMLLALTNSPGLYQGSYIITARQEGGVSCGQSTGLLSGSGQLLSQQILLVSGGELTQE